MPWGRRAIRYATLSLYRFDGLPARLWAFAQMGLARPALRAVPGIGFHKLVGSGTGEGFTPVPNTGVYGILACWKDLDTARDAIAGARPFTRWRSRAAADWTVYLDTVSARGKWAGASPFTPASADGIGPLVALTRATLRPRSLREFWRRVPAISARIGDDPNTLFKIGIGEVPWLHQVTFSVWPDAASMADFARASGPHAEAIRAVREGDWFREELYARFRMVGTEGDWPDARRIRFRPVESAAPDPHEPA